MKTYRIQNTHRIYTCAECQIVDFFVVNVFRVRCRWKKMRIQWGECLLYGTPLALQCLPPPMHRKYALLRACSHIYFLSHQPSRSFSRVGMSGHQPAHLFCCWCKYFGHAIFQPPCITQYVINIQHITNPIWNLKIGAKCVPISKVWNPGFIFSLFLYTKNSTKNSTQYNQSRSREI